MHEDPIYLIGKAVLSSVAVNDQPMPDLEQWGTGHNSSLKS